MRTVPVVAVVLAYGLLVGWLRPVGESFDGLAYLMAARAGELDYGHALYLPLLRLVGVEGGELAALRHAKALSAVGAALACGFLWRAAAARGASALRAALVATAFGLGTLFWQEAGSIEPTTWTIAALLLAAEACEAYARRPSLARLAAAVATFGVASGLHVVSVCALPWLVSRARPSGGSIPRAHALVPLAAALATAGLALWGGALGEHWRYWSGFVPSYAEGVAPELARNVARGARLLGQGAPVLLAGTLLSAVWLARTRPAQLGESACLGAPYALAFLAFGRPLVGLLVPVLLAAALLVARAAAERRARTVALLALWAALELAVSLPRAVAWARGPDDARERVALFARHVPPGAVLFAGPLANHFRFHQPGIAVVALSELWHQALARGRAADPVQVVRAAVDAAGRPCVLSSDGVGFLVGDLGVDPAALGLVPGRALFLPENPRLALFPLDGTAGDTR